LFFGQRVPYLFALGNHKLSAAAVRFQCCLGFYVDLISIQVSPYCFVGIQIWVFSVNFSIGRSLPCYTMNEEVQISYVLAWARDGGMHWSPKWTVRWVATADSPVALKTHGMRFE
jgi:hypothetical protein